ncbi:hypothetical protein Taro_015898 [Colocasia esculenta]|uniref:Uncharacterized protein n=1 Tax=Colocasia esculenta TaxID=4460 RepID=A0A843UNN5_COLES|nr:hypothetical protein [Colocasia esculenta]
MAYPSSPAVGDLSGCSAIEQCSEIWEATEALHYARGIQFPRSRAPHGSLASSTGRFRVFFDRDAQSCSRGRRRIHDKLHSASKRLESPFANRTHPMFMDSQETMTTR